MIGEWIELGWYSAALAGQIGRREASRGTWSRIMRGKRAKHWIPVLLTGGDRYCPIRNVWSCGFWVPLFTAESSPETP